MNKSFTSIPSTLMRHWFPSALVFGSVMAGALAYLKVTPQLYEAKAQLTLDDRQISVSNIGHDLAKLPEGGAGLPNPLATQAELIKSPTLLKRALVKVQAAGVKNVPPISQLSKELRVKNVPATNILELSYRGQSPKLTAELLNAVTASAVEENLETIRAGARSIKEFLEAEVPKQRAQLERLEAAENRYRQENQLVAVEEQTKELVKSLETIQNQERDLSTQLQEAIVRNASLRKLGESVSPQSALTSVRVGQDEELKTLRAKLNDLEARVIEARSRFSDRNPILLTLTEQRDEARKFYQAKLARIVPKSGSSSPAVAGDALSQDLISKSIASNIDRAAIEQKLAAVKKIRLSLQAQLANLPNRQQPLTTLTRNREESAATLKLLQAKLQEASLAETQLVSNLKIIAPAELPTQPEWPKKSAVLSIAAAFGLVLTIGVILVLEFLDNCLHDSSEAELMLAQTTLGKLPSFPHDSTLLPQGEFRLETYHLVEPYRKLLKRLKFDRGTQIRRLVIGSALASEGKSMVAAHLAMVAAMQSRRTLLIDANLWQPEQHRLFNLPDSPGLAEVLEGKLTLEQSVQPTRIANLSLLTCGNLVHSSFGLDSARMKSLLAEAERQFDLVIVDTPALASSIDAFEWSHHSDGLVLVVCPGVTTRNGLAQAWADLHKEKVPFFGFVVNRVNLPLDLNYIRPPRLKQVSWALPRRHLPSSKPDR
ncbi:GumC family protein [Chamaesiphon minutus]|uniref:Capsular exopolysaccharide biosynthesis protein n=1 Tax=Chamaesiphon minutus (strain ATCC 27169 / PCC 6605) TaxID=1173020 RepID=K9UCV6_CHAP6|nr:polysaccharide biosynthesis tyrosine autokinase [Chamaesiphon minutus]AFY92660.1 capsular exopolysaccharide biosynthesis protein [Chamaesiphon minutus PCC 6605]